jgi:hypothetical protein
MLMSFFFNLYWSRVWRFVCSFSFVCFEKERADRIQVQAKMNVLKICAFCLAWSATCLLVEQSLDRFLHFQHRFRRQVRTVSSALHNWTLGFAFAGARSGWTSRCFCAALHVAEIASIVDAGICVISVSLKFALDPGATQAAIVPRCNGGAAPLQGRPEIYSSTALQLRYDAAKA